jgi:2-oxoglutarate ferredoxin oxidoreductase subunit gamma
MLIKILLAGDGGQGIQLISDLLAQAAFANGFFVSQIPNYGLEQRGGVSLSFLQISDKEIAYSKFTKPDILLVMSEQARNRMKNYELGIMNYDIKNFEQKLEELKIGKSSHNIFFLGLLAKMLGEKGVLKKEKVFELLEKKLGTRPGWEENRQAFQTGTL